MPTTHPIIEPPIPVLKRRMPAIGVFLSILFCSQGSMAQEAAAAAPGVAPETAYILNTLLFLIAGFLVMFMAAGFAMLEAGLVRKRSVGVQCLKNVSLFAISGIMFYLVGYNLMYSGVDGGYMGIPSIWSPDDSAALAGDFSGGYAASSDWFFQMVFVATAASIVSGTVAERMKLWPFMVFVVILTGVLYPITGSWEGLAQSDRAETLPPGGLPVMMELRLAEDGSFALDMDWTFDVLNEGRLHFGISAGMAFWL